MTEARRTEWCEMSGITSERGEGTPFAGSQPETRTAFFYQMVVNKKTLGIC
jgi:hypothetical protein